MSELSSAIIIDNGSGMCKAGLAENDAPQACFPAVVGYPKYPAIMPGTNNKEIYIADEAISKKGMLHLDYPIEHGVVKNWEEMTNIWQHCFYNELRTPPS